MTTLSPTADNVPLDYVGKLDGIQTYLDEQQPRDSVTFFPYTATQIMHPLTWLHFKHEGAPVTHVQAVCDWYAARACRELDAMLERLLTEHGLLPIGGAA